MFSLKHGNTYIGIEEDMTAFYLIIKMSVLWQFLPQVALISWSSVEQLIES